MSESTTATSRDEKHLELRARDPSFEAAYKEAAALSQLPVRSARGRCGLR